ncbi:phosphotransferase [Reichenbachiella versicolor]|uniref:phosphotransferase n=1 Tax=Reichenbachiella versicolor TaxID=1821036 RepID=UPI000D6E9A83|nr:phosphotransferase [Reichenbachiella versicolor]
MSMVPVLSTIISPDYLSQFCEIKYGYQSKSCTILKTGVNHHYLLTTISGEKFVIRVYFKDWRTEDEIEEELALLDYLKKNRLTVAYPIENSEGQYIQKIEAPEGERYVVLFSYVEGETIRKPTADHCYHLGVEISKMHKVTINKSIQRQNYTDTTLSTWAYKLAKSKFGTSSYEMKYFGRAKNIISEEFNNAKRDDLRQGVVHLDLWYENMKIKDDKHIAFFDFDNCGNGWQFLDIAYCLMLIYRNEPIKESFDKKKARFYEGYESIIKVTDEEKRLVPYGGLAIWLHYSGIHVQRFDDFSNHFLSEEFLKYWIHTVDQWMKINEIEI